MTDRQALYNKRSNLYLDGECTGLLSQRLWGCQRC